MKNFIGKKVIVYGMGNEYSRQIEFLKHFFCVVGCTDKYEKKDSMYISREMLGILEYDYVYIASSKYEKEIKEELIKDFRIRCARIISASEILASVLDNIGTRAMHIKGENGFYDIAKYDVDIYSPRYNPQGICSDRIPDEYNPKLYNSDGREVEVFFLRDYDCAHAPWALNNKYFIWDRFNYRLDTHFYTNSAVLEKTGGGIANYAMLREPRAIQPYVYEHLDKNKGLYRKFENIFTQDSILLNSLPNAKFVPLDADSWYGRNNKALPNRKDNYRYKDRMVSILSSSKEMTDLHILRKNLAVKCRNENLADAYGTAVGEYVGIERTLERYRYSIVIENEISEYWFTEKLTSCLEAQTIPIYLGATKIQEFFNVDGMIIISKKDLENIEQILKQCTERYYEDHIPAILDNYYRVKKYVNAGEYLYEHYLINRKM